MRKYLIYLALLLLNSALLSGFLTQTKKDSERALFRYLAIKEPIAEPWTEVSTHHDDQLGVTQHQLHLISQYWPKKTAEANDHNRWEHTLNIFIPAQVKTRTALLYINNGTRHTLQPDKTDTHEVDWLKHIVKATGAIVVELRDVPNQYLQFGENDVPRKEDALLAYTFEQVLDAPERNAYWAIHLPMTKAAVKAMDAVQAFLSERHKADTSLPTVDQFIVAGASKRGWTAWLTAIADDRVSAVVPIVIDILNTRVNLKHIYSSYGRWPKVMHDYEVQGILARLDSPAADQLLAIEDPMSYLYHSGSKRINQRFLIPKYIINASGDDFFVPDATQFYLDQLPGETMLRYVPNSAHKLDQKLLAEALISFMHTEIRHQTRPKLITRTNKDTIELWLAQAPQAVTLWVANNPKERDFRYNPYPDGHGGIRYQGQLLDLQCDHYPCQIQVPLPAVKKGWQAAFVELHYKLDDDPLVLTSQIAVRQAS